MALLTNALYIAQGEINCIVTEMKRSVRFPTHSIVSCIYHVQHLAIAQHIYSQSPNHLIMLDSVV